MIRTRTRVNTGCSGCIGSLIGLIFMVLGFYLLKDTLDFLPGTVTAQGTIIHCSYGNSDDDGGSTCNPRIRFKTGSGQSVTIGSSLSSSSFYVGKMVQVKYHPKTPQDGRIDSFSDTWMIPLLCIGSGLIVFLIIPLTLLSRLIKPLILLLFLRR